MKPEKKIAAYEIKAALSKKHNANNDFFLTEVKNGQTWGASGLRIMDALAIKKSWTKPVFTGYEIKVSRSDFLSDEKWPTYLDMCNQFYFVCPKGMIEVSEVDKKVGIIYYNPENKSLRTKKKAIHRVVEISWEMLYYIILSRLENQEHPFFSSKAEYYRAWVANKINNRELGFKVKSKIIQQLSELYVKKSRYEKLEANNILLNEIMALLRKYSGKWVNSDNAIRIFEELMNNKSDNDDESKYKNIVEQIRSLVK